MSGRGGKAPRGRAGFNSKYGGISLDRFARAKKSTYDPREVKEKERARNAITVAKYKKLKKKLQRASDIPPSGQQPQQEVHDRGTGDNDGAHVAAASREEHPGGNADPSSKGREFEHGNKRNKHSGGAKRIQGNRNEDLDTKNEEEEAAMAAAAVQKEAAKQRRQSEHKIFKKKTHRGQPIMKHRIEKMLHQLEKN
ncbi:hypothetical protein NADE_003277 [Nannochloris sp. 'desiccata']|nr:hypothetical protein KSW81_000685 [Chlorella desiccata (nom. nud.)]KAH7620663.1 hypothetical protein NADE_003277 [Chlorella desiccata (nom. nud.)]